MARTAIDPAASFEERRRDRYVRRGERQAREQLMDLVQGLAIIAATVAAYTTWWWMS